MKHSNDRDSIRSLDGSEDGHARQALEKLSQELPQEQTLGDEEEEELLRCSVCGYKYSCATCILYGVAARWAASTSTSSGLSTVPGLSPSPSDISASSSSPLPAARLLRHVRPCSAPPASSKPPGPDLDDVCSVYCVICDTFYSYPVHNPPRQVTERCTHFERACEDCIQTWLETLIERPGHMHCPIVRCAEVLRYEDVKYWAGAETWERHESLILRRYLSALPGFFWCLNPRCSSGQYHITSPPLHPSSPFPTGHTNPTVSHSPSPPSKSACDPQIITCHACESRSCAHHQIPWHEGQTCAEYDRAHEGWLDPVRRRERGVRRWIGRKTKKCPGCGRDIEKHDGCDHMTCRPPVGCGAQFCWRCGADYSTIFTLGVDHHKRWCRYYRPKNPIHWKFWRRKVVWEPMPDVNW